MTIPPTCQTCHHAHVQERDGDFCFDLPLYCDTKQEEVHDDHTCPHHTPNPAVMRDIEAGYWGENFKEST